MSDRAIRASRRPLRTGRLPATAAFWLQLSIVVFFLASSSAPTSLYARYEAEWGFSPITVTAVFGVYALAVLAALLTVGSLSDHVGRRPVLLVAIAVQVVAMLIFARAGNVPALLAARIVQGLATGAAVGALGAGLVDLNNSAGTIANAAGPMTGTAVGGLLSGLLVQYLPDPSRLIYLVLFAVFALQAAGVALMPESSSRTGGALASLRPRFALPPAVRGPMLAAAPALIAVWALAGFYGSLGPALVRLLSGSGSPVLGGLALFVLAASGVFFVGTTIAGVGFGGGFQGAIRTVLPLAAPHERAGVLSIVYVLSYLALGLPAVIAGVLAVHGGVLATAREYGAAVMVLSALALAGLARRRVRGASGQPAPAAQLAGPADGGGLLTGRAAAGCLTAVPGPLLAQRAEQRAAERCPL